MSEELFNALEKFIPSYLVNPSRDNLKRIIKEKFPKFTESKDVYSINHQNELKQGDCLDEIPFFVINNDENNELTTLYYSGIVLSNSCSINPSNVRFQQSSINFAQVYPLSNYYEFLNSKKLEEEKINNHIRDIKANLVSRIIYLPELYLEEQSEVLFPESIVVLDKITTIPLSILNKYNLNFKPDGDRYFTLSNYGLLVFIFKLSVHFCRFSEYIDRDL
ncbi:MAG: hypothetical protein FIA92_09385 [Chloroflexi bacterium]|nr:hypothetical protein [Chloroflexota bacterium]